MVFDGSEESKMLGLRMTSKHKRSKRYSFFTCFFQFSVLVLFIEVDCFCN